MRLEIDVYTYLTCIELIYFTLISNLMTGLQSDINAAFLSKCQLTLMAFYVATKLGIVWYLILYDISQKHKKSSFQISQRISPQNEHSTLLFISLVLFFVQKHSDQSRASSSCSYSHLKERHAVKSNNNPLQILKVYQYCHE